jgi:hypothetical protein
LKACADARLIIKVDCVNPNAALDAQRGVWVGEVLAEPSAGCYFLERTRLNFLCTQPFLIYQTSFLPNGFCFVVIAIAMVAKLRAVGLWSQQIPVKLETEPSKWTAHYIRTCA